MQLDELEVEGAAKEEMADKLRQANLRVRDVERSLAAAKKDVSAYQDMLEQSQVRNLIHFLFFFALKFKKT